MDRVLARNETRPWRHGGRCWSQSPFAAQLTKDTVNVAPGERYDVEFTADQPGTWIVHCHIPHHMTNAHASPGGLLFALTVKE
jgi:FtsP/CotA-like multicopper oxidase with cupredoxin domain